MPCLKFLLPNVTSILPDNQYELKKIIFRPVILFESKPAATLVLLWLM